jgi:uncharacterized protein YndB with AHSA1/START domain
MQNQKATKTQKNSLMEIMQKTAITVTAAVNAPVEKVWECWTVPIHIMHWNNASDDWHTTIAENNVRVDGKFRYRMESRDGNQGFDFSGKYSKVAIFRQLEYTLDDDRKVHISFESNENKTVVTEKFEAEQSNTTELQRKGWQAILNNFKKYVETSDNLEIIHYEITINADPDKVYKTLISKKSYSEWTSEFNAASHFEGTWDKGGKIRFLGQDADGKTGGMLSRIKENIPGRFISIEHLEIIKDGEVEDNNLEIKFWAGALENYTINGKYGKTLLSVDMNINKKFMSYYKNTWPKALSRLKAVCET